MEWGLIFGCGIPVTGLRCRIRPSAEANADAIAVGRDAEVNTETTSQTLGNAALASSDSDASNRRATAGAGADAVAVGPGAVANTNTDAVAVGNAALASSDSESRNRRASATAGGDAVAVGPNAVANTETTTFVAPSRNGGQVAVASSSSTSKTG